MVLPPEVGSDNGADFGPSSPPVIAESVCWVSRCGICGRGRPEVPVCALDRRVDDIRPLVDRHQRGTYRRKSGRSVGRQAQIIPTLVSTEPIRACQFSTSSLLDNEAYSMLLRRGCPK